MQTLRCDNCKKVEEDNSSMLFGWLKVEGIGPEALGVRSSFHFCSALCATEYLVQLAEKRSAVGG